MWHRQWALSHLPTPTPSLDSRIFSPPLLRPRPSWPPLLQAAAALRLWSPVDVGLCVRSCSLSLSRSLALSLASVLAWGLLFRVSLQFKATRCLFSSTRPLLLLYTSSSVRFINCPATQLNLLLLLLATSVIARRRPSTRLEPLASHQQPTTLPCRPTLHGPLSAAYPPLLVRSRLAHSHKRSQIAPPLRRPRQLLPALGSLFF